MTFAQQLHYGSDSVHGKYLQVNDAAIYYEVYGEGKPLVLLHGDFYGYIDEFALYLPLLARHFRVIAIAKRGHGRSEIGHQDFTERLFAEDVLAVLRHETKDSAIVLGFSSGATTAYYLAAYFPGAVRKVVGLAGGLDSIGYRLDAMQEMKNQRFSDLEKNNASFLESRKKLMPQPGRLEELFNRLQKCWVKEVFIERSKAANIKCPVLVVGGDRDHYSGVERFVHTYYSIPGAELAIVPDCGHVDLVRRRGLLEGIILPFMLK